MPNSRSGRLVRAAGLLAAVAMVAAVPVRSSPNARAAGAGLEPLPVGFSQGPSLPAQFAPRWDLSFGYFPPSDQVVVFGGAPVDKTTDWRNDTWLYAGGGWSQGPGAPAALSPRAGAAMAYDPDIQRLVMFGGQARASDGTEVWPPYPSETWLWDGTGWAAGPAPPGLSGRVGAEMVYDDALGQIVLFGGSGVQPFSDTWLFDGTAWTRGPDAPADMPPREFFGMAYDPGAGEVVVAGGDSQSDVWLFDGTAWTRGPDLPADIVNPDRERTRLAYDPQIQAVVLFGGLGPNVSQADLYYLRASVPGAAWTRVPERLPMPGPDAPPPARLDGAIVWVPTLDAMMLFGGIQPGYEGRLPFTDSWFFRETPPQLDQVTIRPANPQPLQGIDADLGVASGGYMASRPSIRWAINGVVVPGAVGQHLDPVDLPGDVIQAQVRLTDQLGLQGPWVSSNEVTVAGTGPGRPNGPPRIRQSPSATPHRGDRGAPRQKLEGTGGGFKSGSASTRTAADCSSPQPHQVVACAGQFWMDGSPLLLHGVQTSGIKISPPMSDANYAQVASWHMNEARMTVSWRQFENAPPTDNGNGTWTHHYNTGQIPALKEQIQLARAHHISVLLENQCLCSAGWPEWLASAPYNSHHRDYDLSKLSDRLRFKTDYWSDDLMKQFTEDWFTSLVGWVHNEDGLLGYEPMDEPDTGSLAKDHSTTQMIMDWQLELATAVRAIDPNRVVFFTTRGANGAGITQADLSGWEALGNVAFDVHDFFAARWGSGFSFVGDPAAPTYGEFEAQLFNFTLKTNIPPYLGTTLGQVRFVQTFLDGLAGSGIPLYVGEFADALKDPNILSLYGTMAHAFNWTGISWNVLSYDGYYHLVEPDGSLKPWVPLLCNAAAYPETVTDCPTA